MAQRVDVQYVKFYTDGSAAKKVAPVVSASTGTLPKMKKQKRRVLYVDPVAMLGIAVAAVMLVTMTVGVLRLQQVQRQTARMEQYVELLSQEQASLQQAYTEACDMEAVEKTAIALGMIPAEDAKQVSVMLPAPQTELETPASLWNRIGIFLSGLFA